MMGVAAMRQQCGSDRATEKRALERIIYYPTADEHRHFCFLCTYYRYAGATTSSFPLTLQPFSQRFVNIKLIRCRRTAIPTMSTEDQEILAKISQLAGEFVATHSVCDKPALTLACVCSLTQGK